MYDNSHQKTTKKSLSPSSKPEAFFPVPPSSTFSNMARSVNQNVTQDFSTLTLAPQFSHTIQHATTSSGKSPRITFRPGVSSHVPGPKGVPPLRSLKLPTNPHQLPTKMAMLSWRRNFLVRSAFFPALPPPRRSKRHCLGRLWANLCARKRFWQNHLLFLSNLNPVML